MFDKYWFKIPNWFHLCCWLLWRINCIIQQLVLAHKFDWSSSAAREVIFSMTALWRFTLSVTPLVHFPVQDGYYSSVSTSSAEVVNVIFLKYNLSDKEGTPVRHQLDNQFVYRTIVCKQYYLIKIILNITMALMSCEYNITLLSMFTVENVCKTHSDLKAVIYKYMKRLLLI